jgi:Domain of unknown function (DUF4397)
MKKIVQAIYTLSAALFAFSCKKSGDDIIPLSSAAFIHASPGTPSSQVYLDTLLQSMSTNSSYNISYSSALTGSFNSGYLGIYPGSHSVSLENRSTTKKVFASLNDNFAGNQFYSYFLYDTLNPQGQARVLRLVDDLTVPSSGNANVRFLNLALNSPSLDVTLVRGSSFVDTTSSSTGVASFVATDSVTFQNRGYVGASPDATALAKFTGIPGSSGNATTTKAKGIGALPADFKNNRYIIKLKTAGTQTVLAQSAQTTLNAGSIYTIFARGTAQGQALGISVYTNYLLF